MATPSSEGAASGAIMPTDTPPPPPPRRVNVPILLVITAATLMSTASSLIGGLIIYQQGIESLEQSVRGSSAGELRSLRDGVLSIDRGVLEQFGMIRAFFFSQTQLPPNDTEVWTQQLMGFMFAQVNSSSSLYFVALDMVVYAPMDEAQNAVYVSVWSDEFSDGSRAMTGARAGPHNGPKAWEVVNRTTREAYRYAPTYALDNDGKETTLLYNWQLLVTGYTDDEPFEEYSIDPRSGLLRDGYKAAELIANAQAERFAGPRLFESPEEAKFLYGYFNHDALFVPPPDPHPWSVYRGIRISVGFLASAYIDVFRMHVTNETTILLVNRRTTVVYASTIPGSSIVAPECQLTGTIGYYAEQRGCFSNITNHFSKTIMDAFDSLADVPDWGFAKRSCDGTNHFLSRAVVDPETSVELMWLRPTSTVDGEVRRALGLLILFCMLILVFDSAVSVIEIVFIAMPLRRLAQAISHMGNMDTEQAAAEISSYEQSCLMVKEIRLLMAGTTATVGRLEEFRTFMPEVVLGKLDTVDVASTDGGTYTSDSDDHSSDKPSNSLAENEASAQSARRFDGTCVATTQLQIHLQVKRAMTLMYVNVVGWSAEVGVRDDALLLTTHANLMTMMLKVSTEWGGTLDMFQGDRFLVGFNTMKRTTDAVGKAVDVGMWLTQQSSFPLSIGLATGRGRCGNMGNSQLRRFTIISPLVSWVHYLEQYNKAHSFSMTADSSMFGHLTHRFSYRLVDAVKMEKTEKVVPLAEILCPLDTKETCEWMYQVDYAAMQDKFSAYNEFAMSVINEDWTSIRDLPTQTEECEAIFFSAFDAKHFEPLRPFYTRHTLVPSHRTSLYS